MYLVIYLNSVYESRLNFVNGFKACFTLLLLVHIKVYHNNSEHVFCMHHFVEIVGHAEDKDKWTTEERFIWFPFAQ